MNTLLLVDGHYFLHRSFAIPFKYYSKQGTPLHVVSCYLNLIKKSINIVEKARECTHLAVVFDSDIGDEDLSDADGDVNKTFIQNKLLFEGYKNNRKNNYKEMEDSPFHHLPFIYALLESLQIRYFELKGVEADDLIATLAARFNQSTSDLSFIASNDSDFFQLANRKIKIIKHKTKGEYEIFDEQKVKDKTGIDPAQYVFYKSLIGDPSDNIPGIKGVGPVRAKQIITGELEFNLDKYKDIINRNLKLIRLKTDISISFDADELKLHREFLDISNNKLFDECGF